MLPAAFQLERAGRLESSLALLGGEQPPQECLLYLREPSAAAPGHCGLYAHRPLICRLFGFSAVLDRNGRRERAAGRLGRAAPPEAAGRADEEVRRVAALVPVMRNYQMELYGIDPTLGARLLPINEALAQALQRVGLGRRAWARPAR